MTSAAVVERVSSRKRGTAAAPVAVYDGLYLHMLDREPRSTGLAVGHTLAECHRLASELGVRQLWLTPAAVERLGLPASIGARRHWPSHPFVINTGGRLGTPAGQVTLAPWLTAWGERPGTMVEVAIPSWDGGSPFAGATFGPALLAEVEDFAEATGTLWRRSGAITSDAWLRDHLRGVRQTQVPPPGANANLEADLIWTREAAGDETGARRCLAFDANAMYLGAASSLPLPVGDYQHWTGVGMATGSEPGYWLYGGRWVTTPTAIFDDSLRPRLPEECYLWRESHRFLEGWYKMLRDARKTLIRYGSSMALEAVKQVYRGGIGRLGSRPENRTRADDPLYQPYWRHAIQAEARCRLLRRVDKLAVKPFAIDVDCLYFLTNARSHDRFAKAIGLPTGDQVGQFKSAGACLGKDAREALRAVDDRHAIGNLRGIMR